MHSALEHVLCCFPLLQFKYVAADGRASVQDQGRRRLKVVTGVGMPVDMGMRVVDVHKALVSAGRQRSRDYLQQARQLGGA